MAKNARYKAVIGNGTHYADRLPILAKQLRRYGDLDMRLIVTEIATGKVIHDGSVDTFMDAQLVKVPAEEVADAA